MIRDGTSYLAALRDGRAPFVNLGNMKRTYDWATAAELVERGLALGRAG